ncbi:hypothetical protein ACFQX7_03105 [Luedemannella flava]|uniref:hypothetical protein n=1 Tax=Luedemannella flava TaxID=349316 RepID=UPI0031D5BB44
MFDLVVHGGEVLDGTGAPARAQTASFVARYFAASSPGWRPGRTRTRAGTGRSPGSSAGTPASWATGPGRRPWRTCPRTRRAGRLTGARPGTPLRP